MPRTYEKELKKTAVERVMKDGKSTSQTAKEFDIPLKTFEKWITAYRKNNKVFNREYISPEKRISELQKSIKALEFQKAILEANIEQIKQEHNL